MSTVAPHAGAWIETRRWWVARSPRGSRPSRRGVDRNLAPRGVGPDDAGRPSRRGVDRNYLETRDIRYGRSSPLTQGRGSKRGGRPRRQGSPASPLTQGRGSKLGEAAGGVQRGRRPSRRGVDRNQHLGGLDLFDRVAPHAGAWIETSTWRAWRPWAPVAPHAGAWIETPPNGWGCKCWVSRPSRRGVDRNFRVCEPSWVRVLSPLTQGRGSKRVRDGRPRRAGRRPSRRGVDRNA